MGNIAVPGPSRTPARGRLLVAAALSVLLCPGLTGSDVALADDPAATEAGTSASVVVVRKGDRGPAVRRIQRRLRISADGVFGMDTHRSVRSFQRRRDLVADGIVGPVTRRALRLRRFSQSSVVHPRRGERGGSGFESGGMPNLPEALERIADCESGGDPQAVSSSGRYRGKYQFSRSTWKEWGGRGRDPARASEAHQDRVALGLYRARGGAPWPRCGS